MSSTRGSSAGGFGAGSFGAGSFGAGSFGAGGFGGASLMSSSSMAGGSFGSGAGFAAPHITAVTINKSLLTPLSLDIDPTFQAVRTQEKDQIKTLNNRFASFIDKVGSFLF